MGRTVCGEFGLAGQLAAWMASQCSLVPPRPLHSNEPAITSPFSSTLNGFCPWKSHDEAPLNIWQAHVWVGESFSRERRMQFLQNYILAFFLHIFEMSENRRHTRDDDGGDNNKIFFSQAPMPWIYSPGYVLGLYEVKEICNRSELLHAQSIVRAHFSKWN